MSNSNQDVKVAWKYHELTKHSYFSVRSSTHFLDWSNQPIPFKIYTTLDPIKLPRDLGPIDMPALEAISATDVRLGEDVIPDLTALARIFFFSAGITKVKKYPGGQIYFRAASCTGALYEIELYLVCGDLPDLPAGVYHFAPYDFALRRLRSGDYRGALVEATGGEPSVSSSPAIVVCTGTYWRNAWKYQARTYRHFFWDNGTILANMLAVATALQIPARIVLGFIDEEVNRLLGLDAHREVALSLVPLGRGSTPPDAPEIPSLDLPTRPLSRFEVDYPIMRQMHTASMLKSADEVRSWRGQPLRPQVSAPTGQLFPLAPHGDAEISRDAIDRVILRRGSTRIFARKPISFAELSTMLYRSTRGIPADFLQPAGATLNDLYLIVNAVEGLPSGAYFFHADKLALELLKEGEFRAEAGYLGLEQELPADASADVFFMSDLGRVLERFGNRGYRAAQLEAGIIGGKLYLAAYAQRLGATGLTFYDDDVVKFFSPHAASKSTIFLVALGVADKQRLRSLVSL